MSGALLQLASMGPQDVYLTGNPEISLFKKAYLRYTNFSTETVQVAFDGQYINFGSTCTVTLEQAGDLISKVVLVVQLGNIESVIPWGYVDKIAHAMIDNITVNIGQSEIDRVTDDIIDTYHNLYSNQSHENRYNIMIGNTPELKRIGTSHPSYFLYLPLEFWFTKVSSSSFPICSINNQKFQINITLKNAIDCINYSGTMEPQNSDLPTILSGYVLVDYIYLENQERLLFKSNDHEYLVEQYQDMTDVITTNNTKISLIFDKPCKYIVWYVNLDRYYTRNKFIAWATDNNWAQAKDNFAKLVWLATREGLNCNDPLNPVIVFNNTYINIGQSLAAITGGNAILEQYANKVNAIILFAETDNNNIVAKATVENVVLTQNNITFQDMSSTVDEILNDVNTTSDQITFIENVMINIVDYFNTGNFINRTDNPIITSSFQLNGKNRFQQWDGNYFNYVQPYYYFTNTPPDGINTYSFCLDPKSIQPTGSINMGQVNSKDLLIQLGMNNTPNTMYFNTFFKNGRFRIFTLSYTILKISQNQASLAY